MKTPNNPDALRASYQSEENYKAAAMDRAGELPLERRIAERRTAPVAAVLPAIYDTIRKLALDMCATDAEGQSEEFNNGRAYGVAKMNAELLKLAADPALPAVPAGWRADLEAIYTAMNHMGDALNGVDAVEDDDLGIATPGFDAIRRLLAAAPELPADQPSGALAAPGWISVDERLPEVGQGCIAYRPTAPQTQDPLLTITHYTGHMKRDWQDVEHGFYCLVHPTHWMPLPAIPGGVAQATESTVTGGGNGN